MVWFGTHGVRITRAKWSLVSTLVAEDHSCGFVSLLSCGMWKRQSTCMTVSVNQRKMGSTS